MPLLPATWLDNLVGSPTLLGHAPPPAPSLNSREIKELSSLGHKLDKFTASHGHAWDRLQGNRDAYTRWLPVVGPAKPLEDTTEGLFAVSLATHEDRHFVDSIISAPQDAEKLASLWQQVDPSAPRQLPSPIASSPETSGPTWLALLRLSPLRDLWDQFLRRATVDTLQSILPDAWLVDPAPLPAGAVIPRLELSSWQDLPRLRSTGRSFLLRSATKSTPPTSLTPALPESEWLTAIRKAQQDFSISPQVLLETTADASNPGARVVAFYQKANQRVGALGFMALIPDGAGKLVPSRIAAA